MAVAFDAKVGPNLVGGLHLNPGASSMSVAAPMTVGSGANRALVALLVFQNGALPSSLTVTWDSGGTNQAMTQITGSSALQTAATATCAVAFGLVAPVSGAKTFAASWTGTLECVVYLVSFTGADQTGGSTTFGGTSNRDIGAGSNPATVSVTASANDAICAVHVDNNTQGSCTLSDTAIDGFVSGSNFDCNANYAVGTGTHALTGTWGGSCNWGSAATSVIAVSTTTVSVGARIGGRIFIPAAGPKRGLRSSKAFPSAGATTLTASTGTFVLTGIASLFRINDVVVKGTFTETGITTLFRISETSAKGTFTETGIASLFRINEVVSKGTFTLTGIAAQQARPSPTGTFTLTGKAALFQFDVPETKGTFVLSGIATNLTPTLSSNKGTFIETGVAAKFTIDEVVGKGTYVLSGKDAALTDTGAATPAALNNWIVDRLRRRINASKT